jgi:hypothetical protein
MMSGTYLYWVVYGRQAEGIDWTQQLLARINEAAPEYQIRLLRSAATLIAYRDREAANRLAQRAVAAARDYGDKKQLGWSLWALSTTLGSSSEAEAVTQETMRAPEAPMKNPWLSPNVQATHDANITHFITSLTLRSTKGIITRRFVCSAAHSRYVRTSVCQPMWLRN